VEKVVERTSENPTVAEEGRESSSKSLGNLFTNPLDRWVKSRVWQLRNEVTEGMEEYDVPKALDGVLPFLDDLSNWFVRRSRRRFWKSEDDKDKAEAYATLHYVLSYFALIIAPFCPFMAEELWQKMVGGESVHLCDWPEAGEIDEGVLSKMFKAREIIQEGLAQRMNKSETEEQVKVRQPLATLEYGMEKLDEFYENIIAEEVNVKKVVHAPVLEGLSGGDLLMVQLDKTLTEELRAEGFARELIRVVQAARKKAGLNVDDRILLSLSEFPEEFIEVIAAETLAESVLREGEYGFGEEVEVEGKRVKVSLEKA
jgi:isoleucyl-tRNA synthetase